MSKVLTASTPIQGAYLPFCSVSFATAVAPATACILTCDDTHLVREKRGRVFLTKSYQEVYYSVAKNPPIWMGETDMPKTKTANNKKPIEQYDQGCQH